MPFQTTHCVFRAGSIWLALPAKVVREVMTKPRMVAIPRSPSVLSGMSHLRSEFLPVLNFSSLFPEESLESANFMLVIEEANGDWGLMVNEVTSLTKLEPSHAPEEGRKGWESTIVGWASHEEKIVRILDSIRFRELAAIELNPEIAQGSNSFIDEELNEAAPNSVA